MSFQLVELDDPGTVRIGAFDIKTKIDSAATAMQTVRTTWEPIRHSYHADEEDIVAEAMERPSYLSYELEEAGNDIKAALDDYATDLAGLKARRAAIQAKIDRYDALNPDPEDEQKVEEKEQLKQEIDLEAAQLAEDKDAAQNRCRARLLGIRIGNNFASAASDLAPRANQANGGTDSSFFQKVLDRSIRSNKLDWPWGSVAQAGLFGLDMTKHGLMLALFNNTRVAARGSWLPSQLQQLAASGPMGALMVKNMTGWDKSQIKNMGRFLKTQSALNPMRTPTGIKDGAKVAFGRSMMKLNGGSNRVALPGKAGTVSKISTASKWVGHAGTVAGAAVTFGTSWQEDSKTHPSMGNAEKTARATTVTAAQTAGGWAGGKAGAAVGAAVGSMIFPGAGTAVGAVAGGIIGGVAGSSAGGWLGNKAKDTVGSWFD